MMTETRNVLQAIRGNDFEVEVRRGVDEVFVLVVDHRRNAESSFNFDAVNEVDIVDEMARRFCSANQRAAIFGESTHVVSDGPYRYAMA